MNCNTDNRHLIAGRNNKPILLQTTTGFNEHNELRKVREQGYFRFRKERLRAAGKKQKS